jgi:hypothetical protein
LTYTTTSSRTDDYVLIAGKIDSCRKDREGGDEAD